MKKSFYGGLLALVLVEFLRVYFIMPMPGSQRWDSLPGAYFLHQSRWVLRTLCLWFIARSAFRVFRQPRRIWPVLACLATLAAVGFIHFSLSADRMFRQPEQLTFKAPAESTLPADALVIGVAAGGEARAYPIRYLVYHHQVPDTVGGEAVIVTYCSVCRTGRVFAPQVNGREETFRLVGMDHFNALFEDQRTGSWWQQATGMAVAGPLKGTRLTARPAAQMTLAKWSELHPETLVMEPDPASLEGYDTEGKYERGENKGRLTRTDPEPWQDKSWVIGIALEGAAKAYDWQRLQREHLLHDTLGSTPILLVLASGEQRYRFDGTETTHPENKHPTLPACQEFWHSWRTFHPDTTRDP